MRLSGTKPTLEAVDLLASSAKVATVSSFGFGGSNACATLSICSERSRRNIPEFLGVTPAGKFFPARITPVKLTRMCWHKVQDSSPDGQVVVSRLFSHVVQSEASDEDTLRTEEGGMNLLAFRCWQELPAEQQVQRLELCCAEVLDTLQQAAREGVPWQAIVAGSGRLAEACFSAAASMLRSAQCEQELHGGWVCKLFQSCSDSREKRRPPSIVLGCVSFCL